MIHRFKCLFLAGIIILRKQRTAKAAVYLGVAFMNETDLNKALSNLDTEQSLAVSVEDTKRKTGREYRRRQFVKKNDRLMGIVLGQYIPHAGYIDRRFEGRTLLHSGFYIKYPKNSKIQKWLKRTAAKSVRRYACEELPKKGNGYRRLFDYWWSLY